MYFRQFMSPSSDKRVEQVKAVEKHTITRVLLEVDLHKVLRSVCKKVVSGVSCGPAGIGQRPGGVGSRPSAKDDQLLFWSNI